MISGVEHETFYNFRTINIFIIKRMYLDTDNIIFPALATDFSGKVATVVTSCLLLLLLLFFKSASPL